jgi:ribosomal protein S12 methylthiotransferase
VDTEVMLGILLQAGYEVAPVMQEADYLVVNTCGFLQEARDEGKDTISEILDEKKLGSKLIVTGCMINLHRDEIMSEYPDIDVLLGSGAVPKILEAIESTMEEEQLVAEAEAEKLELDLGLGPDSARSYLEDGEVPRQVATPPHYGYLKIAEGCRKKCSFCIIPKIKGGAICVPFSSVVLRLTLFLVQRSSTIKIDRPSSSREQSPASQRSQGTDLHRTGSG